MSGIFTGINFANPGGTRQMNIDNFLKHMGLQESEVQFNPVEFMSDSIESGTDAAETYKNQLGQLNAFGMAMAAKGIDVLKPSPNIPGSSQAAQVFQQLLAETKLNAVGMKAGFEIKKLAFEKSLQDGIIGGQGTQAGTKPNARPDGSIGATTFQDVDLSNVGYFTEQMDKIVNEANEWAIGYDNNVAVDKFNEHLIKAKGNISSLRESMLKAGVDSEVADQLIKDKQGAIGAAFLDPSLQEAHRSKMELNKARKRAANRPRAGRQQPLVNERLELIRQIQQDPSMTEALIGRKYTRDGSSKLINGAINVNGKDAQERFMEEVGLSPDQPGSFEEAKERYPDAFSGRGVIMIQVGRRWVPLDISGENDGAFSAINEILNTTLPASDKVTLEEISRYTGASSRQVETSQEDVGILD